MIAKWGSVYIKLDKKFQETGAKCIVHSAFSKWNYPLLIISSKDHVSNTKNDIEVLKIKQATSARKASEWGMRAFQGPFPGIKGRLVYEGRGDRKMIILHLHFCSILVLDL